MYKRPFDVTLCSLTKLQVNIVSEFVFICDHRGKGSVTSQKSFSKSPLWMYLLLAENTVFKCQFSKRTRLKMDIDILKGYRVSSHKWEDLD